ncbi:MAG TPA: glutaredoxin family protein [Candidatus Saccharimonadales bacterium]|nr:glutaredoxin family protein [Candidatus Saccharimonadales bacterium]
MKKITVYTTNSCAYCEMVKRFLNGKGVDFNVVNLDEEPSEVRQKVIEMSGAMTVPVIVVEKELETGETEVMDITVGWNPGKLASAVA